MHPKAKTLIESHGFLDRDRLLPKHDEIQLWCYNNFHEIISTVFSQDLDKTIPLDLKLEFPISALGNYQSVVGFVDIFCPRHGIAIEVKTSIPVIGDLIRQIQFYRKYLSSTNWIVICPDDRAKTILKDQGILFFKYSDPGSLGLV